MARVWWLFFFFGVYIFLRVVVDVPVGVIVGCGDGGVVVAGGVVDVGGQVALVTGGPAPDIMPGLACVRGVEGG